MKRFLFLIFALVGTLSAGYSQRVISGTVTDAAGQALIGANVIAKEATAIGTITDVDGNFSLKVPAEVTTLVISYAGYETKEVVLGSSNAVNVTLSEGQLLQEVVVTGLGIKRNSREVAYANQTVNAEELLALP
ncbi:MAG TPA: carboxypeptidase-like regulatory domain-containing protein, partial [Saprospiraceae bacterium]|nr:carboxypeptidase-like regulatory domain-containing protein [Saprospiraceae bacterium]